VRTLGSVPAIVAAIHEEAAAEAEAVKREAAALAAEPARADEEVVLAGRDKRLAEARRSARERLAREDWEDARQALELREQWMARVVAAAHHRLAASGASREELGALTREAVVHLPGGPVVLVVSPDSAPLADRAWLDAVGAVRPGAALHVVANPGAPAWGCVARTEDGRVAFDNTLAARSRRLERTWRVALGKVWGR
jgi:vacuolar-type H+-ATPase subunit E/Vma4